MNKSNNKTNFFGLGTMSILVLVFTFMPFNRASATFYGRNTNIVSEKKVRNNNQDYYPYYQEPTYVPTTTYVSPTPTIYSSTNNPTTTKPAPKKTVTKAKTTTSTAKTTTSESDLAANALFGSNSFLPSGLIQWILFAILVLIAVIITRKIYGGEKKYHATPMKHA